MSDVLADLYVILRAESGQMVGGFAEAGLSGEQMATKIATVTADVEAEIARLDASLVSIGQASDDAAIQNAAAMDKMRANTIAAITSMEAAEAEAVAATEAMATKIDAAAATSTATTAGKLTALKSAGVAVGIAAALVAAGSVKMAADFDAATERMVTSAGETQSQLDSVRQGILAMASQVGYSSDDLAAAMYKIESGGQHGAAGLAVLQAAAQGAKTENADLTTVADAVTSVLQDYHLKASDAATVTSQLVAATSAGKVTFQELAGSLSSVLPIASANHVALYDVLGDLSSMTIHGMSAQQATDNLSDAIKHMAAPTQAQSKELAALGMNSQQLSTDLGQNGLYGVIQNISQAIMNRFSPDMQHVVISLRDALSKSTPAVQDLGQKLLDGSMSAKEYATSAKNLDVVSAGQAQSFATLVKSMDQLGTAQNGGSTAWQSYTAAMRGAMGDATGLNVALMLTGDNSKTTAGAIDTVYKATADAQGNVKGWSEIQGQFNTKLAQAKDGLGALAISIGEKLLPVASAIAGALATATQWMSQHKQVAEVLAIAVGIGLVIAFSALLAVFWGFAANPVTWIIAGIIVVIGLLALGVYELVSHWSGIMDWFANLWRGIESIFHTVINAIGGFLSGVWNGIVSGIVTAWNAVGGFFSGLWNGIVSGIVTAWNSVIGFLAGVWRAITSGITAAWDAVLGAVTTAWNAITGALTRAWTTIVNATRPIWQPIVTIISNVFQIIYTIVSTVITIIGLFIEAGWRQVVLATTTVWNAVSSAVSGAWNLVSGIVMGAVNAIGAGLANAWNWISGVVMGAVNAIGAGLANAWNWIWGIISSVWNGIVAFFVNLWNGIVAEATQAWNMFVSVVSGPIHAVWSVISSVWNTVVDFLAGVWDSIVSGVSNGVNNVVHGISGLADKIWGAISGIGKWLWDAGVNLIEGLLNGIASMTGKLLDKVKQMASDAVNTVKSWLGIASPSKVFQLEVGAHIPTGVAAGIDAAAAQANASARRMALGVLQTSKDILGQGATIPVNAATSGATNNSTALALAVGSSGSTGTTTQIVINLTVQGNVWTEQDLIKAVQNGLLKVGIQNTSNFTSYNGFGGG